MHISELRGEQQQALLDLAVLGMYLDGNLARVEDGRVKILLAGMGFETEYDRGREFDASVTRIRPHVKNADSALNHAKTLAIRFSTPAERQFLDQTLSDLISSDGAVSNAETAILNQLRSLLD